MLTAGRVSRLICTYSHLLSLFMLKFNHIFIQIRCVRQKRLFFSKDISICHHEISFFYFKLFCEPKLAKTLLIFSKQNLRCTLYISLIPYFEKYSARNKVYKACLILLLLLLILNVIPSVIS